MYDPLRQVKIKLNGRRLIDQSFKHRLLAVGFDASSEIHQHGRTLTINNQPRAIVGVDAD